MHEGQGSPVLWMWDEGDFKKIEKPLEGLLLKTVLFKKAPTTWLCPRGEFWWDGWQPILLQVTLLTFKSVQVYSHRG